MSAGQAAAPPTGTQRTARTMATGLRATLGAPLAAVLRALAIGVVAFVVFGPLANLALWAVTEKWYYPHRLPLQYGFSFWARVFAPRADAWGSLASSLEIAVLTVALALALSIPAGYALARLKVPLRSLVMLAFLVPQAFPDMPAYINIARIFYGLGLAGTVPGVVIVHTVHGLVFSVWIATAAFAAIDGALIEAARNLGAGALKVFMTVTLPLASSGLMAAAIFVFLDSLDEFTGTYFVGVPDITTLPILMFNAGMGGNYQIASITAIVLLVPSVGFMLVVERFLRADVLAGMGR